MKAKELLKRYQAGERDFQGVSLRGQSFRGQELSGANFSGADIRSANFSKANLTGADFSRAEAGLQKRWAVALTFASWVMAGTSGLFSGITGGLVSYIFDTRSPQNMLTGWVSVVVLIVFWAIFLRRGIVAGAGAIFVAVVVATFAALTIAVAAGAAAGAAAGTGVGGIVITIISCTAAVAVAVTVATAGAVTGPAAAVATLVAVMIAIITTAAAVATLNTSAGAAPGLSDGLEMAAAAPITFTVAIAVTITINLLSFYIGWRALAGISKYKQIHSIAIGLATFGGTSFRCANLKNASFKQAKMKSVDLRNAKLIRTCWSNALKLDRVRPGDSYLQSPAILSLVKTGYGQGKNFDFQNLRGINLKNAHLGGSSFRAADLSEANLQDADLTRASLVQTQLDDTDLTGACLTGATIEDWGITGDTQLRDVRCEYVYMRYVRQGDPDPNPRRKPDNYEETFEDGDFSDFIRPIMNTLDLYHNRNVNSKAIAIAFKQLSEDNQEAEPRIIAMESRGPDKFMVRVKTEENADKSELSSQYFSTYEQVRKLSPAEQHQLLMFEGMQSLMQMLEKAISRPSINVGQLRGDFMPDHSGVNINAGGNIGDVTGTAGRDFSSIVNLGNIVGDVRNSIQQLSEAASDQPNLKDLLTQLQNAISEDSELDDTEKTEALAQVKKLAEAGQAPQEGKMRQLAKRATGMLSGLVSGMTEGAQLVTAWEKVGPVIMTFFGLL